MSSFHRDGVQLPQSHTHSRRRKNQRSYKLIVVKTLALVCSVSGGCYLVGATAQTSAQKKADMIEQNRWPASRSISFDSNELLALARSQMDNSVAAAIQKPELHLENAGATATALVDFDQLRSKTKASDSVRDWLMQGMVSGQHSISVSVQVTSGAGTMTVHPTSVTISGVTVSGDTLQFLIRNFVVPRYPDAAIDKPFVLNNNIKRVSVTPAAAIVFAK